MPTLLPSAGVRTIREECLDPVLIFSQPHLQQVLDEYVAFYNQRRPHQGIEQRYPDELPDCEHEGIVFFNTTG